MLLHKIKCLCEKKKINIAELERNAEITRGTICNWDHVMPAADKLARVAKVLGTTSEELLKE